LIFLQTFVFDILASLVFSNFYFFDILKNGRLLSFLVVFSFIGFFGILAFLAFFGFFGTFRFLANSDILFFMVFRLF